MIKLLGKNNDLRMAISTLSGGIRFSQRQSGIYQVT